MEKSTENSVYELLAMTASDSSSISDVPDIVFRTDPLPKQKKRKRRLKRHQRNALSNPTTCDDEDDVMLPSAAKKIHKYCFLINYSIIYILAIVLLLSWLIMLTVLLVSYHTELTQLDSSVLKVMVSSQSVPDELQKCHSLSKQLEHNQTELLAKFNSLSTQIKNFSIQISELHITISKVEEKLNASPQVIDVPARLTELSNNVALFGSTINDLTNTVNKIKEQSNSYDAVTSVLQANITSLKGSIDNLTLSHDNTSFGNAINDKLSQSVDQLRVNLTNVNETLNTKLKWVKTDQMKDHSTIEDLQGLNANVSTRISSLQVDVNSIASTMDILMGEIVKLNTSLYSVTPTTPIVTDFQRLNPKTPKLFSVSSIESTKSTELPLPNFQEENISSQH